MNLTSEETLKISVQKGPTGPVTLSFASASGTALGTLEIEESKLIPLSHALHHFFKERATSAEQIGKYRATIKLSQDIMEIKFE